MCDERGSKREHQPAEWGRVAAALFGQCISGRRSVRLQALTQCMLLPVSCVTTCKLLTDGAAD